MLGKLIKYDIRATWRDFVGVYGSLLLGVLILPQIFKNVTSEIIHAMLGFIAMAIVIATIVVMIMMLFKIFNNNVFSKEGYLLMTLPVTPTQIVGSKLIVSTMWVVLTGIVSVSSLFIFFVSADISTLEIFRVMKSFLLAIGGNGIRLIILLVASSIFSVVKEISKLFLACSIANLKKLGNLRIVVGILSYFIFSWLEVLFVKVFISIGSVFPGFDSIVQRIEELNQISLMSSFNDLQHFAGIFNGVVAVGIAYSIILISVYALGTIWILNRKLDL